MTLARLFAFGQVFVDQFFVRPGNEARKPLSMASFRVELTGEPREAWWNCARSFFVVSESITALHV